MTKKITVTLDPATFSSLHALAKKHATRPATLAAELIAAGCDSGADAAGGE